MRNPKKTSNNRGPLLLKFALITIGIMILGIFSYYRLKSIYFESVAYTYDQGRDFYKAAEIVTEKDLTFIGPTTGIDGIFHGAWWYYYLTIPFILFGGSPIGFYYANFIIHLICIIGLALFFKKFANIYVSLSIAALIAISPYFVFTSVFVGNNIMVLPAMVIFLGTHFVLLEKYPKKLSLQIWLFLLIGFSLGLISEFEFAFGLMIIPVYIVLSLIIPKIRGRLYSPFKLISFMGSLILAFMPRILFEVKNDFSQTRTLISFILKPKYYNPKPYFDIFMERFDMVIGFYTSIFPNDLILYVTTICLIAITVLAIVKRKLPYRSTLIFLLALIAGLFLFSTLYRDNFWSNYYEGFPYIYIFCIGLLGYAGTSFIKNRKYFVMLPVIGLVIWALFQITLDIPKMVQPGGLKSINEAARFILDNEKSDPYCVKICTPPAIPHTYNYLFLYEKIKSNRPIPETDWIDGACWIVLEYDQYPERKQKWVDDNVPKGGTVLIRGQFHDIFVQKYVLKPKN